MAKIIKQLMKNGFVVLNINTNENSFMNVLNDEGPENSTIDQTGLVSTASRFSNSTTPETNLIPITIDELFNKIGINKMDVNSLHLQGSRLYGTANAYSDWDLIMVAANTKNLAVNKEGVTTYIMNDPVINKEHKFIEFVTDKGEKIQIHAYDIVDINDYIKEHDMAVLEFVYHPDSVKIIEKGAYDANIDKVKLVDIALKESQRQWDSAKIIYNTSNPDTYMANKRIWHAFRYLIFADQILKDGRITDFSAANYLYTSQPFLTQSRESFVNGIKNIIIGDSIVAGREVDYDNFDVFENITNNPNFRVENIPIKKDFEDKLKSYI